MVLKKALSVLGVSALLFGLSAPSEARRLRGHTHPSKKVAYQTVPAAAVSGLAASHDMRREGGRLCFADHAHYGSSSGMTSLAAAQKEAITSWASFVDFEYGSAWANYGKASGKDMKCSQAGGGFGCDLGARPCQ